MDALTTVRFATMDDAPAICTIYNQGIDDRVATLETELPDTDERRRWLSSRGTRYPVIVAEGRGQIIGWSSLNAVNARRAYAMWLTSPSTSNVAGAARGPVASCSRA